MKKLLASAAGVAVASGLLFCAIHLSEKLLKLALERAELLLAK